MSALGQKQTYAVQKGMSALPPIATAKADFTQSVMSALPPKADMCDAARDVRFGPIADIAGLIRSPRRRVAAEATARSVRGP
jgi:hypothetical protein